MLSAPESGFLTLGRHRLHYLKSGSGKKFLIAFHGYGQDAAQMLFLAPEPAHRYTLLSFDLPYHGRTLWDSRDLFWERETTVLFATALQRQFGIERWALAGYSLGGRLCLCLAEYTPASVERVTLLASDGLVKNHLYYWLTRTRTGGTAFRHFISHPVFYKQLAGALRYLHLLHPARHQLFLQCTRDPKALRQLYLTWRSMSRLLPCKQELQRHITKYQIPVHLFMGAYDRIIPPRQGFLFARDMPGTQVHLLKKGHQLLDKSTRPEIIPYLFADS